MATLDDTTVRRQAFNYVLRCMRENRRDLGADVVTGTQLNAGIDVLGEHIHLISPGGKGIPKPRQLDKPLLIITKAPIKGSEPPYEDEVQGGLVYYRYRRTDPYGSDNRALRQALHDGTPVLYLRGVDRWRSKKSPSTYLPRIARLVDDKPDEECFVVALEELTDNWQHVDIDYTSVEALIASANVQQRLDQAWFRLRVLRAYRNRCTLCRLNQRPLLDAAHIRPHSEHGLAIVPNGLAMCTLHHRAFDRNIIGISPSHRVSVRAEVLDDSDGPMLEHGLQGFHHTKIWVPGDVDEAPKREFLAERYADFLDET